MKRTSARSTRPGSSPATPPAWPSASRFVYLLAGSGRFGANQAAGTAGQVLWLDYPTATSGDSTLDVQAETPARFLVLGGRPIREPVAAQPRPRWKKSVPPRLRTETSRMLLDS